MNTLISSLRDALNKTKVILAQSVSYLSPQNVISKFVKRGHEKDDDETISTRGKERTGSRHVWRDPNLHIFRKRITKRNRLQPLKTKAIKQIVQDLAEHKRESHLDPFKDRTTLKPEIQTFVAELTDMFSPSHDQESHSRKRKNLEADETDRKRQKIDSDSDSSDNITTTSTTTESANPPLDEDIWSRLQEIDMMPYEQVPWIPELGLTLLEKIALSIPNCPLNRRVTDAAQFLLKQQFITEGLQPCTTPWFNMQPVFGPAIQIHGDLEANHCFTTCYRNYLVEIAQAFPMDISPSVLKQIETIYQYVVPDTLNYVRYLNIEPPEGPYDCVLYAIALAYEILNDGDLSCTFDNAKMREHLVKCFMCREITEFPKISQIS